jgi:hypothetical protein
MFTAEDKITIIRMIFYMVIINFLELTRKLEVLNLINIYVVINYIHYRMAILFKVRILAIIDGIYNLSCNLYELNLKPFLFQ